jgi:hypothetical protein
VLKLQARTIVIQAAEIEEFKAQLQRLGGVLDEMKVRTEEIKDQAERHRLEAQQTRARLALFKGLDLSQMLGG